MPVVIPTRAIVIPAVTAPRIITERAIIAVRVTVIIWRWPVIITDGESKPDSDANAGVGIRRPGEGKTAGYQPNQEKSFQIHSVFSS